MMFLSLAPYSAVVVAKPDLRLWPAYFFSSKPALRACFLIIKATFLSDIGKTKTPAESSPTKNTNGKPLTVPMDQIPGENASQAEKDEYLRRLDAGELTGGNSSSEVPPPAPVLPPPPQMTPQSSPSVGGIETYDEPQQGSTAVIPIPQQSAPSGGGGGGGRPMAIPGPSTGSLLNSYYKQQLLGFLYKQG